MAGVTPFTVKNTLVVNTAFSANSTGVYFSAVLTINATNFVGTSNNATNLGGVAAANYVQNSGAFTLSGVITHSANLVISTTAGLLANGTIGTAGQVLTSNASTVYWSSLAASATTDTTNAGNISAGTLGTARLGSGAASSSTYLRGDQTWVSLAASATTDTTSATNISAGTLGTARLGSGTANSTTYLRGDQTWAAVSATAAPGGSNTQIQYNNSAVLAGAAALTYLGTGNNFTITSQHTTDIPLVVAGIASQAANLVHVANSGGSLVFTVSAAGVITGNASGLTSVPAATGVTNTQSFTASGTWTKPTVGTIAFIQIWGGGAGGSTSGSYGGGGGGYCELWRPLSSLGATVSVTIAAGGAANTVGGTSQFGTTANAYGGGLGSDAGSCCFPGAGGGGGTAFSTGGTGSDQDGGGRGGSGGAPGRAGANAMWGGAGGAGATNVAVALSINGGNGANSTVAATVPGGGGASTGNRSGVGGKVIVTVF